MACRAGRSADLAERIRGASHALQAEALRWPARAIYAIGDAVAAAAWKTAAGVLANGDLIRSWSVDRDGVRPAPFAAAHDARALEAR